VTLPRLAGCSSLKSTSLVTSDRFKPACLANSDSPGLTSSGPAALHQEGISNFRPIATAPNFRMRSSDFSITACFSSYIDQPTNTSTILPSLSCTSECSDSIDLSLSRSFREPTQLLSITHEGSIRSPREGRAYDCVDDVGSVALLVSHLGASQDSLQLRPNPGPTLFPLSQTIRVSSSMQHPHELCASSAFAALVRASELARITDAEAMDNKGSL